MQIDITQIIVALIGLIGAVITYVLVPFIKSKTDATMFAKIQTMVQVAVTAAEQIYTGTGMGQTKKKYVLDFLESKGYTVDEDTIDKLIESAVYEMKQFAA